MPEKRKKGRIPKKLLGDTGVKGRMGPLTYWNQPEASEV